MPEPDRTSVSAATLAAPLVPSSAPLGFDEFAQPCAAAPLFAHGHGVPVPSPKQIGVPDEQELIVFCRMHPLVTPHAVGHNANVPCTKTWSPSWKLPYVPSAYVPPV